MPNEDGLHVVFGASGGAGGAIVRELTARGQRVRAVTRSGVANQPAAVEVVRADAANPDQVRQAMAGATVVYHAVNVPYPAWSERLPPIMEALIEGAAATGVTLVYVDNLYLYGPVAGAITEDLPPRATTRKGRLRARLAEQLLQAHATGRIRAAIGRASDFYGPGGVASFVGERLFTAVLSVRTAMWAGTLDLPHSLTYIDDFARVLITLGEQEAAWGHIWHAPPAEALTGRQFLELVFDEAGLPPKIGAYRPWQLKLVGLFNPTVRELGELSYQFTAPFVLDGNHYQRTFGGAATPHRDAIRRTLGWYRSRREP
jgi:nucleoside-diphosphate-sugar epimerase